MSSKEHIEKETHIELPAGAFAALVDAAVDGVVVINETGVIIEFNRAACQMFGFEATEVVGKNVSVLMSEEDANLHDGYLEKYRKTGKKHIIGIGRRVNAMRKDEKMFPAHLCIGEFESADQRYFVGIVHDLTEEAVREAETNELRQHLAQMDRVNLMGEMASGIAHELNQPLTAISSYVQACRRRLDANVIENKKINTLLEKADEQSLRAGKIIRRIQGMVRPRSNAERRVGINSLVAEVVDFVRSDAIRRHIDIKVLLAYPPLYISADAIQIQQVVLNLVRNAIDVTESDEGESGDRRVIIKVGPVAGSNEVVVSVRDYGSGILNSVLDRLFEAFVTTKTHGTGMGLSISRTIISAYGGRIWFEQRQPGSEFFFTLPLDLSRAGT